MNPNDLPLRDIHLPESVSWWPLATGWWLLFALLALVFISLWMIRKIKSRRRLRKEALGELREIEDRFNEHQNFQQLASEVSILLRRIAISRFPRTDVAGLNGKAWIDFLNRQANVFNVEVSNTVIEAPYQKECNFNGSLLITASRVWIQQLPSTPGNRK